MSPKSAGGGVHAGGGGAIKGAWDGGKRNGAKMEPEKTNPEPRT